MSSIIKITFIASFLFNITIGGYAAHSVSVDPPLLFKVIEKDFPLFKDSDYKVLYVDFELITANIKTLRIVQSNGEIIFKDDVSKSKVDAIYEIDYSSYENGTYRLELFAFNGDSFHADFIIQ